jgi:imidazoleglycerol phosphate synthase glutamine amidotransferase subunit HisH
MTLYLLDYGAGNVASLANSLKKLGHEFAWIKSPEDFAKADVSHPPSQEFHALTVQKEAYISWSWCIQACNG